MSGTAPSAHELTAETLESGTKTASAGHHHLPHLHHNSANPDTSSDSTASKHHKNSLGEIFRHDDPSDFQPSTGTTHYEGTPSSNIKQSTAAAPHGQGVSRVNTDGNIVQSDDPSTNPNASVGQKLMGDVKGAWNGTVGSLEAATGAMIRNKGMQERGMEKMQTEDERLGAKAGVMPIGSSRREGLEDA